ncbi:MAG TPA: hypothetical protein VHV31_09800 [Nitrolancea sp.]|jgi:hypothetical protein|nr:hypothetical protein [Nitrolancea sp.]
MSQILDIDWTRFRTMRFWVFGITAAVLVIGTLTAAAGLAAVAIANQLGERSVNSDGTVNYPINSLAVLHVELGTAALLTAVAALTVALGMLLLCAGLGLGMAARLLRRRDA